MFHAKLNISTDTKAEIIELANGTDVYELSQHENGESPQIVVLDEKEMENLCYEFIQRQRRKLSR